MYEYTKEQVNLFDTLHNAVQSDATQLIKVNAVAGSSKSSSLIEATRRIKLDFPSTSVRYLVFNSANAQEARAEFGTNAIASTLHSLAHYHTVGPYKLSREIVNFLTWKLIPKHIKIPFGKTPLVLNAIVEFCDSECLSFDEYALRYLQEDPNWTKTLSKCANQVLDAMASGKMKITHSFYQKLFHILVMNGTIQLDPIDLLLVDEVQDLTPITLDIVNKYPAKVKVLVGDKAQAIYGFMGCISAFDYYENVGTTLTLSKSFRVQHQIAKKVESFCNTTFDPKMIFEGMEYPPNQQQIKTKAYITRTNLELISKMIELNELNHPYKLATSAKVNQIFEIPKAIIKSTPGGKQYKPELEVVQDAVDEWASSPTLQEKYSKIKYISEQCQDVPQIAEAVKLIATYGPEDVMKAHDDAERHKTTPSNQTLLTAHTSKGLTFDEAELSPGMNKAINPIMDLIAENKHFIPNKEEKAELLLYYVACTRARHNLVNATYLFLDKEDMQLEIDIEPPITNVDYYAGEEDEI